MVFYFFEKSSCKIQVLCWCLFKSNPWHGIKLKKSYKLPIQPTQKAARLISFVGNITGNSNPKKAVFVTAQGNISDFWKREVDGIYPRQGRWDWDYLLQFEFDMGGPTGLKIGYAEVICNKFRLLDAWDFIRHITYTVL